MATLTKNTYWLIPSTQTGYQDLTAGEAVTSDGTTIDLTGFEKIITVYTTGSISINIQHNPTVSGSFWIDTQNALLTLDTKTKIYKISGDIEGDVRVIITNTETTNAIKVKTKVIVYTITGAYITIPQYRELVQVDNATVSDDVLCRLIDIAHQDVIRHVGTDAVSTDTFWRTIQEAEAMLATHHGVIRGWDLTPIDKTSVEQISSQWLEQYRKLIIKLTGQDPYPSPTDAKSTGGAYDATISTITPDEDSYDVGTTR